MTGGGLLVSTAREGDVWLQRECLLDGPAAWSEEGGSFEMLIDGPSVGWGLGAFSAVLWSLVFVHRGDKQQALCVGPAGHR